MQTIYDLFSTVMATCTSHLSTHHHHHRYYHHYEYHHHHYQWYSITRGRTREHASTVNLVFSRETHAHEKKKEEWRWGLRKDLAEQCSYVMCGLILKCFSMLLLTHQLHLNAWQQAAEDRWGNRTAEWWLCERGQQKKSGVKKNKGRESHTLGNGVSDDRTFLGDICEESKRIIFLFPPLQRYLLWHIAVLCYRTFVDVWSHIFQSAGPVSASSEAKI